MELCVGILVVSTIRCRRYRSADRPCSEGGCCGDKKKMMMKWMDYQNEYQLLLLSFSSYPSTTTTTTITITTTITAFMMSDYSYKARICGFLRR